MSDDPGRRGQPGDGRKEGADFDRLGALLPPAVSEAGQRSAGPGSARVGPRSGGPGGDEDPARRVTAVWAGAVGPEVAANARPVQLREGRLVVTTSSSAWAQTLQMMSPMVMAGLNDRLNERLIEKIVFRHAGWEEHAGSASGPAPGAPVAPALPEAPAAASSTPTSAEAGPTRHPERQADGQAEHLSAEERQALADLEQLPLDPVMKAKIREAMTAGFVRARQDSGR